MSAKYDNYYKQAGKLADWAEWLMYASSVVFLLNAFCPVVHEWAGWKIVLNVNTLLLIIINAMLIMVSWLIFAARGNKLAGCIDNAYNTTLAQESPNPNYYDNNNVVNPDLKFTLNIYESCYFSDAILGRQTLMIVLKNLLVALAFFVAIAFEYSHVVMSILGLFIVIHYLRKLFIFLVVKTSLTESSKAFQMLLSNYKQGNSLDMQAVMLYVSNYETAMVWLGTVLSGKIYNKYNAELTNEWMNKQKTFLRGDDTK